jgi:UDP-N-acetylglucosamine acyltransferase
MGQFNIISKDFKYGEYLKIGDFNKIMENVKVGNNVEICNYVLLKPGTICGNDCYFDSYVLTSGDCVIGNHVIMRYRTVIARNVIIEDDCFFTAGVKTIFLDHSAKESEKNLVIKKGCYFGDNSIIMGGITIAEDCIIGANSFVNKDTEPGGVYAGSPARRFRDVKQSELWYKK